MIALRRTLFALATLLALAPLAGCGGSERTAPTAAPEAAAARPNILLLTVDTLRADHLSSWGYPRATSPVLDRMAAEGVQFLSAQVQRPKTGPSFTSIFTATYCADHGIRKIGEATSCGMRFLAEELRELGYQTHAVVANAALAREFYFDQGFDTYIETWKVEPRTPGLDPTGAEAVSDLAVGMVEHLDGDRPWFLWVHYVDPHEPYSPPAPYADLFQGDEHAGAAVEVPIRPGGHRQSYGGIARKQRVDGRTDLPFYVARYDAEVRYVDQEIDRLLEALRVRGDYDRMLTVMTSDHGESLGEHNYWFDHGMFAYQTCLRVPLVVRYPGVLAPRQDPDPVELVDLAPTILDFAGRRLRDGRWMRGATLRPRMLGEASGAGTLAFAEAGYGSKGSWIRTVVDGRWSLHALLDRADRIRVGGDEKAEVALFDLVADPGETVNVAADHPEVVERLRSALEAWEAETPLPMDRDADECGEGRAVEDNTEAQLRALGYL
ncbi:MAG TPA: sulfatase [Thermoanaerobaculia bacterium]|nr:sulfatase [Thermoanaerobaculia bacterium]